MLLSTTWNTLQLGRADVHGGKAQQKASHPLQSSPTTCMDSKQFLIDSQKLLKGCEEKGRISLLILCHFRKLPLLIYYCLVYMPSSGFLKLPNLQLQFWSSPWPCLDEWQGIPRLQNDRNCRRSSPGITLRFALVIYFKLDMICNKLLSKISANWPTQIGFSGWDVQIQYQAFTEWLIKQWGNVPPCYASKACSRKAVCDLVCFHYRQVSSSPVWFTTILSKEQTHRLSMPFWDKHWK